MFSPNIITFSVQQACRQSACKEFLILKVPISGVFTIHPQEEVCTLLARFWISSPVAKFRREKLNAVAEVSPRGGHILPFGGYGYYFPGIHFLKLKHPHKHSDAYTSVKTKKTRRKL